MRKSPSALRKVARDVVRREGTTFEESTLRASLRAEEFSSNEELFEHWVHLALSGKLGGFVDPQAQFEMRKELLTGMTVQKVRLEERLVRASATVAERAEEVLELGCLLGDEPVDAAVCPVAPDCQHQARSSW